MNEVKEHLMIAKIWAVLINVLMKKSNYRTQQCQQKYTQIYSRLMRQIRNDKCFIKNFNRQNIYFYKTTISGINLKIFIVCLLWSDVSLIVSIGWIPAYVILYAKSRKLKNMKVILFNEEMLEPLTLLNEAFLQINSSWNLESSKNWNEDKH